jgi:magnesium-transporting ATPase (P-type)
MLHVVVFFVAYAMFYEDVIMLHGRNAGLWVFGTWTMTIAILVVTVKVALETVHWVWLSHASIWVSLGLYAALRIVLSVLVEFQPVEFYVFQTMLQIPSFYAATLLCIVASLLPDFTFK